MNWLAGLLSIGININYDSGNRSAPTRGPGEGGSDAQRAAAEQARRIMGYRTAANAGTKYKPNAEDKELIGVTDAILFWASESGVDNSTDDDGNSGLHLILFDTTTRADSAQIKLLNDSGSTQYVVAAAIKAKPIIRMSGEQGFTHDSFVDYQDIFLSGENTFEFGNNFVVTKAQLEQLADYYAKTLGVIQGPTVTPLGDPLRNKHIYAVSIPGRCWWFEPGEWYTLQVGGAGQREYIDSVVECYDVTVDAGAGELGTTNVAFREVEQNWVKDSNAVARFLATGDPRWKPNNFGRVVVAAKDYLGVADYYCDGTADQTEIQAAIDYLANAFGGGMVELTEGQFNITAAIELKDRIGLRGAGTRTIIEKNCNDYALEIIGTSSIYKTDIALRDMQITKNDADTNGISLIYLLYAQYCELSGLTIQGNYDFSTRNNYISLARGILIDASNNCTIAKCNFINNNGAPIYLIDTNEIPGENIITNCQFHGYSEQLVFYSNRNIFSGNVLKNCNRGIILFWNQNIISNNILQDITNSEAPALSAIEIGIGATANHITGNKIYDCGNLIDESNCEAVAPPAITPENANTLTNCTYTRSDVQEHGGTYSYLLTKTVAAGTASTAYLTDGVVTTDMHGLYAGQEYRFGAWVYIPAGGMLGSELTLVIRDYVPAAWVETAVACANTYDAWQYVEVTRTLRATATGATFGFAIAAAAADTETAYTDNLRLTPMGTGNLHNQNFYDAGTNTYTGL